MPKKKQKSQLILIDEDTVILTDINKVKTKKKLIVKQIPSIRNFILLLILIVSLNNVFIFKYIFKNINNNNIYYKEDKLDIHEMKISNNINFIKYFKLKKINTTEVSKYLKYIDYAQNGIYLYPQNLEKIENPKVSIIISIYNREDYVKSAIRSIQNQNMKEIEIIYIDDYSSDNSTKYIKEEQKNDPRIVLYKNKQNMGALYSKSIGVLLAKGEYVYSLDSDDMFCSENYLNSLYELAKKKNYEYLHSKALYINLISKRIKKRYPHITVLWAKLIKTKFYRKAIYSTGYNALNNKVNVLDDDVLSISLLRGNYKFVKKIGVAHFIHPGSHVFFRRFSNKQNRKKYCLNIVNTIKALYAIKRYRSARLYGNKILRTHFYNWPCARYKKDENVQQLLEYYKSHRKKKILNKEVNNNITKTKKKKKKKNKVF